MMSMKLATGAAICTGVLAFGSLAAGTEPVALFPDGQAGGLKCYEVKDSSRARGRSVTLEDEFGRSPPKRKKLRRPAFYCNPVVVDRGDAEPVHSASPLACYRISSKDPRRTVEIENALGAQTLVIDEAKHICLPSLAHHFARGDRLRNRGKKDGKFHDPAEVPPVTTEILLSSSETVLGQQIAYPTGSDAQITAAIVTLQPGAETGLHLHEVPLFGYLIQGELTVTYETGFVKVLRPGDSLLEAINTPHNGRNTSKGVVRIFVVFAGAKGVSNTVPLE